MAATILLLARHGETDWNVEGRWQGHTDRALTEHGRAQAEELAARLAGIPLDAVYTSDLRRAWETAEPIAQAHGLELHREPGLREVDVGSWAGLTRDEAQERFPDGYRHWEELGTGWEDGETYEQMAARVIATVRRIAADHPGGHVLVVSHGGSLRAVHAAACGVDLGEYRRRHPVMPNAEVTAIAVDDGRLSEAPEHDLD